MSPYSKAPRDSPNAFTQSAGGTNNRARAHTQGGLVVAGKFTHLHADAGECCSTSRDWASLPFSSRRSWNSTPRPYSSGRQEEGLAGGGPRPDLLLCKDRSHLKLRLGNGPLSLCFLSSRFSTTFTFPFKTKTRHHQEKTFLLLWPLALVTAGPSLVTTQSGYESAPGPGETSAPKAPSSSPALKAPSARAEPWDPLVAGERWPEAPELRPGGEGGGGQQTATAARAAAGDRLTRAGPASGSGRAPGGSPRLPARSPPARPAPRSPPTRAGLRLLSVCASCWPR